ncbi:hypothetical protein KBC99_00020 [Candidatus Saccharibacteria bacterium]|nr:hypothetical protein [Candidatus Saccharibacteria bacterium]
MTVQNLTLIDNGSARARLEKKYAEKEPSNNAFDAHLATFGAYGWRQTFHRLAQPTVQMHDVSKSCEICLTASELCVLFGTHLISQRMQTCISLALSLDQSEGRRSGRSVWNEAVRDLPHCIAQAIEPQLHEQFDLPILSVMEPCHVCMAAGQAVTANWLTGFYDNLLESNINKIHHVFSWSCPIRHPSSD